MWKALIKLIEKWECCHEWETHRIIKCYKGEWNKLPDKVEETLICQKCGKIKKIKL